MAAVQQQYQDPIGGGRVCRYWVAGNCHRNRCKFLHPGSGERAVPPRTNLWTRNARLTGKGQEEAVAAPVDCPNPNPKSQFARNGQKAVRVPDNSGNPNRNVWNRNPHYANNKSQEAVRPPRNSENPIPNPNPNSQSARKSQGKICQHWVSGHCAYGDGCRFLHSGYTTSGAGPSSPEFPSPDFFLFTSLKGHNDAVTGVVLPAGSDKLFSGDVGGVLRVWDCETGQCSKEINLSDQVGCLMSQGSWVFAGLTGLIKAWSVSSDDPKEIALQGPVGQVYCMAVCEDVLFAGAQDGAILAWKFNGSANAFEFAGSLKGHTGAVVSLAVPGGRRLYSASMDGTIRVWDLEQGQCTQILRGHCNVVMSLLCWDTYLISCSLDKSVLVWSAAESRSLETIYTHKEEEPIIALHGIIDTDGKPVLFCSLKGSVRLYELPSFTDRGKILTKEVRAFEVGPDGLFFSGDGNGAVGVWKWQDKQEEMEG